MWNRNKYLLVPLVVIFAGGYFLFKGEPPASDSTSFSKGYPFPPAPKTKTEWTVPTLAAKITKSISYFFYPPVTDNLVNDSPSEVISTERLLSFTCYISPSQRDRAPPPLS